MADNFNSRIGLVLSTLSPWDMSMLEPVDSIVFGTTIVYNRAETYDFPISTCSAYNIFWLLDCKHSV